MNAILVDSGVSTNALARHIDWKKHGVNEVFTASTIQRAQDLFRSNAIDIMISEVDIAQGSGFTLLEWARSNSFDVECIYVTHHAEFDCVRKAMNLGSAGYVLKPLDYPELEQTLSEAIRRVRMRHGLSAQPNRAPSAPDEKDKEFITNSAKLYIRKHIREKIYIADIAKTLSINEWNLMRTFKAATGTSISRFIMTERLWIAKELLVDTNYPVRQISHIVGYENHAYFIRMFKQITGTTPKAYRLAHRANQ